MSRHVTKEECDLIVQGAVVLAGGGGGPLHFARYILDGFQETDRAHISGKGNVNSDDWLTMIALIGTPSKVHDEVQMRQLSTSSVESSYSDSSPLPSPCLPRKGKHPSSYTEFPVACDSLPLKPNQVKKSICRVYSNPLPNIESQAQQDFHSKPNKLSPSIGDTIRMFQTSSFLEQNGDIERRSRSRKPSNPFRHLLKHMKKCRQRVQQIARVNFLNFDIPRRRYSLSDNATPHSAAENTFEYLQKLCKGRGGDISHHNRLRNFNKFAYILTGELGAVNMATALYLSMVNEIPVVDCDGAGRSVPKVNQITYAEKFPISPTAMVSAHGRNGTDPPSSTLLDLPCGSERIVESVAGTLISVDAELFSPYIGYGSYVVKGEQLGDVPVYGSYALAYHVGKAVNEFRGESRAVTVSRTLTFHGRANRIIFHGFVTSKVLSNSKVKDTGYIEVKDKNSSSTMRLWYHNEVILSETPGETPCYMAPDSICILPAYDLPMDISSIPDPAEDVKAVEVFIIVVEADDKIKVPNIIQSFEAIYPSFIKSDGTVLYDGDFVPFRLCDDAV